MGTDTIIQTDESIIDTFKTFLTEFKNNDREYYYHEAIQNLLSKEKDKTVSIYHTDLFFDLQEYFFNTVKVEYHLSLLTEAVRQLYQDAFPDAPSSDIEKVNAKLVIDDKQLTTKMTDINTSYRNKLVVFDSTIISKTEKKGTLSTKRFRCVHCNSLYKRKLPKCRQEDCDSRSIVISVADSKLTDCEYIECQERQEDIKLMSSVPIQLNVKIYGDLVGKFKAGDNVRVIGITKIQKTVSDTILNRSDDDEFSSDVLFDLVVEAHNIMLLSSTSQNPSNKSLTEKDIQDILKLRKQYSNNDNELLSLLVNSFAPHIYGHSRIKEAILLQNVGSVEIRLTEDVKNRAAINILLVGDPGVTKTQLLQAAVRISINGQMASGKGASGVGLTASVTGNDRGVKKLSVGPVVLAHGGLCCLDEYGNIAEEDTSYLLDCMESGVFRVNKNGINAVLNADAAFLIATNPDSGKYNRYNSLFDNVTMTDQFYSRIHITFVMPDIVNREHDEKIYAHVASSYDPKSISKYKLNDKQKKELEKEKNKLRISNDLLFKYLLYARTYNPENKPILSKEALAIFGDFYNRLRKPERSTDITATPRQLGGIFKLAIARARLMLRNEVTEEDAYAIVNLLTFAYNSAGMILQETGGLNLTMEYSKPLEKLSPIQAFTLVMIKLTKDNTEGVSRNDIIDELMIKARWQKTDADEFFDKMYDSGKILVDQYRNYTLMDR